LESPVYHVLLEGRKVGPYDRRTIVGMRIKNALTSDHVLISTQGEQLTVSDLVKEKPRDNAFQPNRSGSYSLVLAQYAASVREVRGAGFDIPPFRDEVELRVQKDVLRIAGRHRQGLAWKDDRVKLPLDAVVHARVRASSVDLWLRKSPGAGLQQLTLELFTPQAAGELVDWLPNATPWPHGDTAVARKTGLHPALWGVVVGTALIVGAVLVWVLARA
jgi:hypothetical protein